MRVFLYIVGVVTKLNLLILDYLRTQLDETVTEFRFDHRQNVPMLFVSDIHLDSIHCKRQILFEHFDEIKRNDGLIFIFGDLLDVMATFGDRRLSKQFIRPEYNNPGMSYLDSVCEDTVKLLLPYKDQITFISQGNHETSIFKYHDTDPLRRICYMLNNEGANIHYQASYSGFIQFKFIRAKDVQVNTVLHYHHGFGGNAKRSKGMLNVQIDAMTYPDADIFIRGHTHQKWHDPSTTRVRLNNKGKMYKTSSDYIQLGSYVDAVAKGKGGWVVEKGFIPTSIGGYFCELECKRAYVDSIDKSIVIRNIYPTRVQEF